MSIAGQITTPLTLKKNWDVFMDTLENPPKPNAKLKQAFAEHKKRVQQS